ncbi:hypothetical protein DFP72DRAFT_845600 [Ephemerocybe angulata]|uniref:Secreted protein n=1 Tax=Ephemerocybe angulata TaxID=980116 RepID=A0A8H6I2K4_9AGAR|nr:hypothetical protein DFP72DRAFT_845600 [Tulosesus angulatus]
MHTEVTAILLLAFVAACTPITVHGAATPISATIIPVGGLCAGDAGPAKSQKVVHVAESPPTVPSVQSSTPSSQAANARKALSQKDSYAPALQARSKIPASLVLHAVTSGPITHSACRCHPINLARGRSSEQFLGLAK